jgi:hypothetical protein
LKKRLLSEYKKLTSGKKTFDDQVREKYKSLKQRTVSGKKTQSTHQVPNPSQPISGVSGSSANNASTLSQGQYPPGAQLSPRHHLNVYKPTFIINNSFANEGQAPNKEIEMVDQMNKKFRPSSK